MPLSVTREKIGSHKLLLALLHGTISFVSRARHENMHVAVDTYTGDVATEDLLGNIWAPVSSPCTN